MLEEILARFVAMAWLGWALAGMMVAGGVYMFVRQRRKKANEPPDDLIGPIPIDGFAYCHVPIDLELHMTVLYELEAIRDAVWSICKETYKFEPKSPFWVVSKVALCWEEIEAAHPHVEWDPPAGRIRLRIQKNMNWHFAGEVHNVFRWMMYGPLWVDETKSKKDAKRAVSIQDWIAKTYKEG
ncbi:MAG: hypothetical protein ACYSW8_25630 [Planctomycetota bacterium]|jgi:hypothetical protein